MIGSYISPQSGRVEELVIRRQRGKSPISPSDGVVPSDEKESETPSAPAPSSPSSSGLPVEPHLQENYPPHSFPAIIDVKRFASSSCSVLKRRAASRINLVQDLVANTAGNTKDAIARVGRRRTKGGGGMQSRPGNGSLSQEDVSRLLAQCETLYDYVTTSAFSQPSIWELCNEKGGVTVWRTYHDVKTGSGTSPTPTIKARRVIDATPAEAYALFIDDSRVSEYNANCAELEDLVQVSQTPTSQTKVNWCATSRFGPFKARDFLTLVHNRDLGDSYASVACNVELPALCPAKQNYVRSQIQLSASFFRPLPGGKTEFIQITQVGELGGVADSKVAKRIQDGLVLNAPVEFLTKFNEAVVRDRPII